MGLRVVAGFGLMVCSAFFFAVSGPVAKTLYTIGWTPGSVVLVRVAGAAVVLLVPTLVSMRGRWREAVQNWRMIAAYGAVSMAGVQAFYFLAIEHLSVALAVLLEVMGAPLIVVFWTWARTRRRPDPVTGFGVLVSLAGVLLVLDLRHASLSGIGVLMAMAAAACFAIYFLIAEHGTSTLPPLAFTGLGMCVGALAVLVVDLAMVMPAHFAPGDVVFAGRRMSWLLPVLLLVVFTAGAYVCGFLGVRRLGATVSSFVNLSEVPLSAFAAWLLLGEMLTGQQFLGGGVVLAGIALVKWGELRAENRS